MDFTNDIRRKYRPPVKLPLRGHKQLQHRPLAADVSITRRQFCAASAAGAVSLLACSPQVSVAEKPTDTKNNEFFLRYILASPMYGTAPLAEVIGEARKIGANAIDIWPRVYANHREQIDAIGFDRVAELLDQSNIKLEMITRYDLGPLRIVQEIPVLKRFGGELLVCGAKKQGGDTVKERVRKFVDSIREQIAKAEKWGIKIGIENHTGGVLATPESLRYFADFIESEHFGLAMAPYHLPQEPELIGDLIEHFGTKLVFFQAWQYGMGSKEKLPKEQELLQMPGRGPLDFTPILAALKRIDYQGSTEIFMHPVPRGIPIRESIEQVTQEINFSRNYLQRCLSNLPVG